MDYYEMLWVPCAFTIVFHPKIYISIRDQLPYSQDLWSYLCTFSRQWKNSDSSFGITRLCFPVRITLTSEHKLRSRLQEEDGCKPTNICTPKSLAQGYATGPITATNKQRKKITFFGFMVATLISLCLIVPGTTAPYLVIVPLYNFQEQSRPVLHRFCENL